MTDLATILAAHPWTSNADLIAACAQLGYLQLADLLAAVEFVIGRNPLDRSRIEYRMWSKIDRFRKWDAEGDPL